MNSLFNVKEKVVLITGAAGVLATSAAKNLAKEGAFIALLTRNTDSVEEIIKEITTSGGIAKAFEADILSESSLEKVKLERQNRCSFEYCRR